MGKVHVEIVHHTPRPYQVDPVVDVVLSDQLEQEARGLAPAADCPVAELRRHGSVTDADQSCPPLSASEDPRQVLLGSRRRRSTPTDSICRGHPPDIPRPGDEQHYVQVTARHPDRPTRVAGLLVAVLVSDALALVPAARSAEWRPGHVRAIVGEQNRRPMVTVQADAAPSQGQHRRAASRADRPPKRQLMPPAFAEWRGTAQGKLGASDDRYARARYLIP